MDSSFWGIIFFFPKNTCLILRLIKTKVKTKKKKEKEKEKKKKCMKLPVTAEQENVN